MIQLTDFSEIQVLQTVGLHEVPYSGLQLYEARSSVEQELYLMLMEYMMRAFLGAFHANPDYMHWYGWAPLKESLARIKEDAERMRSSMAQQ